MMIWRNSASMMSEVQGQGGVVNGGAPRTRGGGRPGVRANRHSVSGRRTLRVTVATQQIEFRGDGLVVAVVMADHDGVDHLAKSLRSGARRANRAVQLLVGKTAHQICARLSALAEQVDHLRPGRRAITSLRSILGRARTF